MLGWSFTVKDSVQESFCLDDHSYDKDCAGPLVDMVLAFGTMIAVCSLRTERNTLEYDRWTFRSEPKE